MIYYVLIGVIIILYPILVTNEKNIKFNNNIRISTKTIYIIIITLFMIIIVGFRDVKVGIDTQNYKKIFDDYASSTFSEIMNSDKVEKGYSLLNITILQLGMNYQTLLIISAIIYIIPTTILIKKYSKSLWFSYFLFITFGLFTFSMSTIRQAMAMGFTMISFIFLEKRKVVPYILFIAIASTFHITAWIFLPAYWVSKLKLNKKNITIIIAISIIFFITKTFLGNWLNQIARLSYESTVTGGNNLYLFVLLTAFLCFIFKNFIKESKINQLLLFMILIMIAIYPITQFNPIIMRLYLYYFIYVIILIPNLLSSIEKKDIRFIGYIGYIAISVMFFYDQVMVSRMQLIPYNFFWN